MPVPLSSQSVCPFVAQDRLSLVPQFKHKHGPRGLQQQCFHLLLPTECIHRRADNGISQSQHLLSLLELEWQILASRWRREESTHPKVPRCWHIFRCRQLTSWLWFSCLLVNLPEATQHILQGPIRYNYRAFVLPEPRCLSSWPREGLKHWSIYPSKNSGHLIRMDGWSWSSPSSLAPLLHSFHPLTGLTGPALSVVPFTMNIYQDDQPHENKCSLAGRYLGHIHHVDSVRILHFHPSLAVNFTPESYFQKTSFSFFFKTGTALKVLSVFR